MSELISLIIAALFGVWAYKKGLFATWAFLFNVIIAVYLGLMLTSPVLSWAGQRLNFLGSYANVVVMVVIAAVYFIITNYLSSTFLTTTYYAIFPVIVDKISSPILGFVGEFVPRNSEDSWAVQRHDGSWHLLFLLIPLISLPLRIGAIANPGTPLLAVLVPLHFR